jgi:transposase
MTQYKRLGIDTSKAVFTVHGVDQQDRPVLRINLRRPQLVSFFKRLPPTEIAMEACGSAHHWARELTALGHDVRLIPPQYVKPYVKRGKNDRNDAEAICEAAGRPGMHFVPMKSVTQQAQGMILKVRETLVGQRTQLVNALRGHGAEFGVIAAKGIHQIGPLLAAIEQETAIPAEAKDMLSLLGRQIEALETRIEEIDVKLTAAHKANAVSQRLATIPGVGPVTALTLAIEIDRRRLSQVVIWPRGPDSHPKNTQPAASNGWVASAERAMNGCAFCSSSVRPRRSVPPCDRAAC